jgi:hypothetical protein
VLFGLRRPPKPGESAIEAKDRQNEADERRLRPTGRPAVRAVASSRPVELFNRDAIAWQRIGERWILALKDEQMIVLDPYDGKWCVLVFAEKKDGPGATGMNAHVAARNLDLGYAMGAAETIIREAEVTALVDREAPWRREQPTNGQLRYAIRCGVRASELAGATRGRVNDLITLAIAKQRLEAFDRALRERHAQRAQAA